MAKLKIEVDDKGVGIEFAGSSDDILIMTMETLNALYNQILSSGHKETARAFKDLFHDPLMVDAIFTTSDEERTDILNGMNKRILEKLFDVFGKDPDDGADEDESE